MRLGLAANRLHHLSEDAALFRWLRACEAGIRELQISLHVVGRTHDAIAAAGMLSGYPGLRRYPYGREGGLMKLVAEVVGVDHDERTLDGAIYLIDPVDPSSVFPEAAALKRQCVIHGKPYITTVASARDWIELERIRAGFLPDPAADRLHDLEGQTLALIAHDAMKPQMMAFAAENFDLLSRFARRVATGTTGQRLNELAWSRLAAGAVMGASLPERSDGRRRPDRRPGAGAALPARDLLRGPARGAPARGRHPAARARGDHGDRRSGVHYRPGRGPALGECGGGARQAPLTSSTVIPANAGMHLANAGSD
jgi:methylglyoxal synthase